MEPLIALLAVLVIVIVAAIAYKMGDSKGKHDCPGGGGHSGGGGKDSCPDCSVSFFLDQSGNPNVAGHVKGSSTPAFVGSGDISKQGGSYDPYAAAIGQASALATKQGIPPCQNVVYSWGDCGNYPAKYYAPTVGAIADVGAFQKAVAGVCGGS